MNNNNVIWQDGYVRREERNLFNGHKSGLVWFTGLSASGKSTIAHALERELFKKGVRAYVLDGDNVRHGLNSDLGFSPDERRENLRRIAELSKLFVDAGIVVIAAFISPFKKDRDYIRQKFKNDNFLEIYVKCSLEECQRRDPKGQYRRARAGSIREYTGISAPYEEPENPDLVLETEKYSVTESVKMVMALFEKKRFIW